MITHFIDDKNNKSYEIIIANNKKKIKNMIKYFKDFITIKKQKIIAIDLEFNGVSKEKKIIALMQINFEINNIGIIYILDPNILSVNDINILIKLLTNKNIIKIIHGGESLDIPYFFNQLLKKDPKKIKKFINNLIDTKYLCEYYNIINKKKESCSIYELYLQFNIITKKKYEYLNNFENIIGPIFDINIDINNLHSSLVEYAYYDVLYLISLYEKFDNDIKEIISSLTQLCYFYKKIDDNNFNNLKFIVTKYNNYFIIIKNEKIKLIDFYNYIFYSYIINTIIYKIININYFKFFIENIIKFLVYIIISKKYTIYSKLNSIAEPIIDTNIINNILFIDSIKKLFQKIYKELIIIL